MASSIETTSSTTILKNNGNTYLSVDTNDVVALTNPLPVASGGTGSAIGAITGGIIQVVSGSTTTATLTTSSSYVDTALSLAITPQLSSSKILVLVNGTIRGQSDNAQIGSMGLVRGSTVILDDPSAIILSVNANVGIAYRASIVYLDSPSTTSATTYKVQIKRTTSAGTSYNVEFPPSSSPATITLMEVAG